MTNEDIMKISIEEFSRVQKWMSSTDKESKAYQLMQERCRELEVILDFLNVNITELGLVK